MAPGLKPLALALGVIGALVLVLAVIVGDQSADKDRSSWWWAALGLLIIVLGFALGGGFTGLTIGNVLYLAGYLGGFALLMAIMAVVGAAGPPPPRRRRR
ncbi:hypothetical protein [Pseudonocardia lacus]|uniref:hypothetical protein n=1 Tax=Pseudonocardia lacus TaxID=2835865 RepID=UPI001BDC48FA|nr:hypothetical protein [Pseudonocardia lacus]